MARGDYWLHICSSVVSLEKVTIDKLSQTAEFGKGLVQVGAGIPMLLIGIGTMAILYMMSRAGKIRHCCINCPERMMYG
jgi:hypothetical protein